MITWNRSQIKKKIKKEQKKENNTKERTQKKGNKERATRANNHVIKISSIFLFLPIKSEYPCDALSSSWWYKWGCKVFSTAFSWWLNQKVLSSYSQPKRRAVSFSTSGENREGAETSYQAWKVVQSRPIHQTRTCCNINLQWTGGVQKLSRFLQNHLKF